MTDRYWVSGSGSWNTGCWAHQFGEQRTFHQDQWGEQYMVTNRPNAINPFLEGVYLTGISAGLTMGLVGQGLLEISFDMLTDEAKATFVRWSMHHEEG